MAWDSEPVIQLLIGALALGIAGFDPLGSVVLVAALGMGTGRRGVLSLGVTGVLTSEVLGLAGALGLTALARDAGVHPPHVPHPVWLVAVTLVGAGLAVWALFYGRRRSGAEDPGVDRSGSAGRARPRSASAPALALSGLVVGLSSLADPAFWAMVVHAARWPRASWAALEASIWVVCSHRLLIVLVICYLAVGPQQVNRLVDQVMGRHAVAVRRTVAIIAGLAGVLLLVDVGVAVATGAWLFAL